MKTKEIIDYLLQTEADIKLYFGKIRNGKTYIATADIIKLLNQGHVVYCNWKVQWQGYNQWENWFYRFLGLIGLKKTFVSYPKENLHYLPIDSQFYSKFEKLTDCDVFLDEGHMAFDSYLATKMELGRRVAILGTGHFNRSIRIISQRPTNIHVQMRGNVNIFVQCEKVWSFGINIFRKTFYEEMTPQETVDLEQPGPSRLYIGRRKIYEAYDSKYLRGDLPPSQNNLRYETKRSWFEQLKQIGKHEKQDAL